MSRREAEADADDRLTVAMGPICHDRLEWERIAAARGRIWARETLAKIARA